MKSHRNHLILTYCLLFVFVLTFSTVWPPVEAPASLRATSPDESSTPTPTATPVPQPAKPGLSVQGVNPPSPEDVQLAVEQALARQAMETTLEKYLGYWAPDYQLGPVQVAVEGIWADGVAQWRSDA